ncbi:hypothetical protein ACIGHN_27050 [Acidovorax sp. NPDC077693]|uniref:hypothetical protein n=1 Tax=unclassified Acidovorax TaxID=2684926 RepID=UPI0037C5CEFB
MNSANHFTPLSGSRLEVFLDDTEEAVDEQLEAGISEDSIRTGLAAALRSQLCRADSMSAVYKLHRLWLRAAECDEALRVLDEQGPASVEALPLDEKTSAKIALAFWRVSAHSQAHRQSGNSEGLAASLMATEALLRNQPLTSRSTEDWDKLAYFSHGSGDFEMQRRCFAAIHECDTAQQGRSAYRAWDDAVLALRRSESYADQGNATQAKACAQACLQALAATEPGQDIDHHDWLKLSDKLIALAPESVGLVVKNIRDRMPPDTSLPVKRGIEVRLFRLEAKAAAAQGQMHDALAKAQLGRYALSEDDDDGFTCLVMDWLLATGQDEAAAKLGFESVHNARSTSAEHACRLAQVALARTDVSQALGHPYWALTMACAVEEDELHWICGDEDPRAFGDRHLSMAERAAPGNAATAAVRAARLLRSDGNEHQALMLLESAVAQPELANSRNIEQLWFLRMRLHGVAKALTLPVVEATSGGWCYNVGVALNHRLPQELPAKTRYDANAVADLAARYYEMGLRRYEAFFDSGRGHYKDGDVHAYAMLCNNLAIHYRTRKGAPQHALPLHHKGIAASPFAEHYHGLMVAYYDLDRKADYVHAADQLWHFAQENGYSRHDLSDYASWVCGALIALDRHAEVPIWLQRLDEWWSECGDEQDKEALVSYLSALTSILAKMSRDQPEDALARLEPALIKVTSVQDPCCRRLAGLTLENAGHRDHALQFFEQASRLGDDGEGDRQVREYAQEDIRRCKSAMGIPDKKPWWKVW